MDAIERENIYQQLKGIEVRLTQKIDTLDGDVKTLNRNVHELQVSAGMLFRSEREQDNRFQELEERFEKNASIAAGKISARTGGRYGAIVGGVATLLAAILTEFLRNL